MYKLAGAAALLFTAEALQLEDTEAVELEAAEQLALDEEAEVDAEEAEGGKYMYRRYKGGYRCSNY